jgi:hypothetical protein
VANAAVHTGSTFAHAATISGLNNNVSYTFGVRVEDQSGNEDANTGTLKATPTLVQTQSTYNLMLSYAANRSGAVFLNDAAVEGNVYVFVAPTTNIKQVKFYIDGTLHQTENIAPYDLAGSADSGSGANPFNTKNLSDGYHTFSAQVIKTNGSSETISADVYVNTASGQSTSSGTTVISAYAQWVSTSSNRSNPKVLNGSTLANRVYVFVKTISDIKRVEFYIDGTLRQTENVAPYDLASTADSGLAVSFDTHALSNGNHQFNARITKTDGSSETVKAAVSVRN